MLTSFENLFVSPQPYLLTPALMDESRADVIAVCLPSPESAAGVCTQSSAGKKGNKECYSMNTWEPGSRVSFFPFKGVVISEGGL